MNIYAMKRPVINQVISQRMLLVIFLILVSCSSQCYAKAQTNILEGFNWYNEKPIIKKEKKKDLKEEVKSTKQESQDLPQYEKNIRSLQKRYEQAHRRALDQPTQENLLAEMRLEKEMMRKSQKYGERRVAVAILDSEFSNIKDHSNVLHRRVQDQIDEKDNFKKLSKLSKNWGIVLQVSEDCPHCHAFAPIVLEFAKKYGFQLLASNKTGQDFKGIEGIQDNGEMLVFNPSRETPMLYLIKGDGKEVLPISRGINSADQIIININNIDKHIQRLF